MTSPPSRERALATRSAPVDRHTVARKWTYLLSLNSYLKLPHTRMQQELLAIVDRLVDALVSEPVPVDQVAEIGARLVELHCVGKGSLRCTTDVLAGALLAEPEAQRFDRLPERVASLLGALASGYAEALQRSTMDQQDSMHRALLEINWQSNQNLRACEARLTAVLDGSTNGIALTDWDGRIIRANAVFDRMLDRHGAQATLFDLVLAGDDVDCRAAYRELVEGKLDRLTLRLRPRRAGGRDTPVSLTATVVRDDDGKPQDVVTVIVDDAEISPPPDRIQEHPPDGVTGLPNREYFMAQLSRLLRAGRSTSVYELEVDGFALLSNGLGRRVGDRVLDAVGQRLRDVVPESEGAIVARLDGATFAILVANSPTAPDAVAVLGGIRRVLVEPLRIADRRVPISVSIGIVHQQSSQSDPAELIHAADLALRRARRKGSGQWAVFDANRDERDLETLALAATMPDALESGQLRFGHRSTIRLADNEVLGVDGLLVWHHPKYGPIAHQRCLELAARTGLILPLGDWLLRRACEHILRRGDLPVHVDLTAGQCTDRDLVVRVKRILADTGLPPTRLRIGLPMAELRADRGAIDNLRGLAAASVQVSIHHFGGAPEDLAYLEDLSVHSVRLSPSLVRRQAKQSGPRTVMTRAVMELIALVHRTAATVVVDDLSTRAQAHWWRRAGADTATGPLFDRR